MILRCHDTGTLCRTVYYTHNCVYESSQKLTGATSSIDFDYSLHHHARQIRRAYGLQNNETHSQSSLPARQQNQCREAFLEYSTIRQHLFQQTVQLRWWSTINLVLCASLVHSLSPHLLFIPLILVTANPEGFEPNESHWFVLEEWGTRWNGVFWHKKLDSPSSVFWAPWALEVREIWTQGL